MAEFDLSRLIPLAAAASLITVGCGAKEKKLARLTCQLVEQCDPAGFDAAFHSMSDCVRLYESEIDEYFDDVAQSSSRKCAQATVEFKVCLVEITNCGGYSYTDLLDVCADEIEKANEKCE